MRPSLWFTRLCCVSPFWQPSSWTARSTSHGGLSSVRSGAGMDWSQPGPSSAQVWALTELFAFLCFLFGKNYLLRGQIANAWVSFSETVNFAKKKGCTNKQLYVVTRPGPLSCLVEKTPESSQRRRIHSVQSHANKPGNTFAYPHGKSMPTF